MVLVITIVITIIMLEFVMLELLLLLLLLLLVVVLLVILLVLSIDVGFKVRHLNLKFGDYLKELNQKECHHQLQQP